MRQVHVRTQDLTVTADTLGIEGGNDAKDTYDVQAADRAAS